MDISRWWSLSVTTGVGQKRFCVPAGTPEPDLQQGRSWFLRPSRAQASVVELPVVTLRSTTG